MQLSVGSLGGKRQIQGLVMGLVVLGVIWELASWIIAGADMTLIMFGLGLVVCALVVHILNDWRSGVLLFLLWLLFEDLARKYLGNSMVVYFAKDFLIGVAYLSFYFAKRRRQVETFKIPFLVPLGLFFALAVIQVFNTWSPNILYGLLGLKLYFYYAPLMLLGYAMMTRPADLERFLVVNLSAGIFIAGLGIAQSVLGISFLTPDDLAPELYELSHTVRYSPVTHSASAVTTSVFVSSGRFSFYLIMLWILAFGAQGYLLLSRRPGAKYGFIGIGVVTVAVMITGTRTPFVFMLASALMMTSAFLWGAPWKWGQGHRLVKALRRGFFIGAIGLILMAEVFPMVLGDHWRFLSETLSYGGQGNELQERGLDYPMKNLELAFQHERWVEGYGTGVTSLGIQYVSKFTGSIDTANRRRKWIWQPVGRIWSFGSDSMVVLGLRSALVHMENRQEPSADSLFSVSICDMVVRVVLLIMLVYFGLPAYQNFVNNAFLWMLVGVIVPSSKIGSDARPVPLPKTVRSPVISRWQFAARPR